MAENTNLKFSTWIDSKGPYTEQCNTGQNEPRSRATSRFRDLLNEQATEALRNGTI